MVGLSFGRVSANAAIPTEESRCTRSTKSGLSCRWHADISKTSAFRVAFPAGDSPGCGRFPLPGALVFFQEELSLDSPPLARRLDPLVYGFTPSHSPQSAQTAEFGERLTRCIRKKRGTPSLVRAHPPLAQIHPLRPGRPSYELRGIFRERLIRLDMRVCDCNLCLLCGRRRRVHSIRRRPCRFGQAQLSADVSKGLSAEHRSVSAAYTRRSGRCSESDGNH